MTLLGNVKKIGNFFQNFVAFSEYLNFNEYVKFFDINRVNQIYWIFEGKTKFIPKANSIANFEISITSSDPLHTIESHSPLQQVVLQKQDFVHVCLDERKKMHGVWVVRAYPLVQLDKYETDPYFLQIFQSNMFDYFHVLQELWTWNFTCVISLWESNQKQFYAKFLVLKSCRALKILKKIWIFLIFI